MELLRSRFGRRRSAARVASNPAGTAAASANSQGGAGSSGGGPFGGPGSDAGSGGHAISRAEATNSASANANGGLGGNTHQASGGDGGDASATAITSNPFAAASVSGSSTARGGAGGFGAASALDGTAGDAQAAVFVTSATAGTLFANAVGGKGSGQASGGNASARAEFAGGGTPTFTVRASSSNASILSVASRIDNALMSGTAQVESAARIGSGGGALASAAGLEAAALATALPTAAAVHAALADNPNVTAALDPDGLGRATGLVVLGAGVADDAATTSLTFDTQVSFTIAPPDLKPTDRLAVGLLDAELVGAGFDRLELSITTGIRGNAGWIEEAVFTDATSALAYFDDRVLDLPLFDLGIDEFEVTFHLRFTSDDPGAAFRTNLVFSYVPEPGTLGLVAFGLAALAAAQRRTTARSTRQSA